MEMSRDDYVIKYADLSDEELLDELVYQGRLRFVNLSPAKAKDADNRISAIRDVILDRMHR